MRNTTINEHHRNYTEWIIKWYFFFIVFFIHFLSLFISYLSNYSRRFSFHFFRHFESQDGRDGQGYARWNEREEQNIFQKKRIETLVFIQIFKLLDHKYTSRQLCHYWRNYLALNISKDHITIGSMKRLQVFHVLSRPTMILGPYNFF